MAAPRTSSRSRELTGRHVLIGLIVFFGVVFAVNGALVRAAISTFGGVETTSSYKAGLQFEHEAAIVEHQDALHWRVNGTLGRDGAGQAILDLTARDARGAAVAGLTADAMLAHPADERLDRVIEVSPVAVGVFHGQVSAQPGQWDLIVDLYRGGERVFRSRNRVTLR